MYIKNMDEDNLKYIQQEGLDAYFPCEDKIHYTDYEIATLHTSPYHPDADDLVRLHKLIRERKVLTALEFGVGYSSVVIADALAKNKKDHLEEFQKTGVRCQHPFKLFSVDADAYWVEETRKKFPEHLKEIIELTTSDVAMGTFNDRFCHYYTSLPNVIPDFIYVDGPVGQQVKGSMDGSDFATNWERTIMSGDLLRVEPSLIPGTMIVFDGRTNNARFLKNNFQRQWHVIEDTKAEVTIFELMESPLGPVSVNKLNFHGLLQRYS